MSESIKTTESSTGRVEPLVSPPTYYGIVVTDGDRLGWLQNMNGFIFHTRSLVVAKEQLRLCQQTMKGQSLRVERFMGEIKEPPQ